MKISEFFEGFRAKVRVRLPSKTRECYVKWLFFHYFITIFTGNCHFYHKKINSVNSKMPIESQWKNMKFQDFIWFYKRWNMKKSITVTKNGSRKHLFKIKTYKGCNIF